ncbi:MAG: hypothetical protein HKM05_08955 [Spirochaetales bacterium]|nr:hypothetical protein [Spirochaetales bacterium]
MSWKVAFAAAGGAFLLSFISAGVGGSDLGSMFLRALFFGILAFGVTLGVEWVLRTVLPELFQTVSLPEEPESPRVDITLEPDSSEFVRELNPNETSESEAETPAREVAAPTPEHEMPSDGEDLPEIGSFLASFGPEGTQSSDVSVETSRGDSSREDYSRGEPDRTPTGDVILDGIAHDPTVLAKAVQTVLKKGQ